MKDSDYIGLFCTKCNSDSEFHVILRDEDNFPSLVECGNCGLTTEIEED